MVLGHYLYSLSQGPSCNLMCQLLQDSWNARPNPFFRTNTDLNSPTTGGGQFINGGYGNCQKQATLQMPSTSYKLEQQRGFDIALHTL